MKKLFRIASIILALFFVLIAGPIASATTLEVGKAGYQYSTIGDALDNAQPGDTIRVMDGATYEESLEIQVLS